MDINVGNITWEGLGVGAIIATILREVFARFRYKNQYNLWQLSNFKDHLDLDYFEATVRECRENIIESKKLGQMIFPKDKNLYVLANSLQRLGAYSLVGVCSN